MLKCKKSKIVIMLECKDENCDKCKNIKKV